MIRLLLFVFVSCFLLLNQSARADVFKDAMKAEDARDYAKAIELWKKLATPGWISDGNKSAQYNLGILYLNAPDQFKNDREAYKMLRLAAGQGHQLAQYNLAIMYSKGLAGSRQGGFFNRVETYMWFAVAAYGNSGKVGEEATKNIAGLEKIMTADQLSNAKMLTKKCIESKIKNCD
jgi:TPR repeat protein